MRRRCDALNLPLVYGHGDLKPSNVMECAAAAGGVCFIDLELAGDHYRGYDLFKLFRTSEQMSRANLRAFLRDYLAATAAADDDEGRAGAEAPASAKSAKSARSAKSSAALESSLRLDELQAETYASEPLSWLEAAVFFLFAIREYPSQVRRPTCHMRKVGCIREYPSVRPQGLHLSTPELAS